MQELIFRLPGMQPFGLSLTLFQFLIYSSMSYGEMQLTSGLVRRCCFEPWAMFELCSGGKRVNNFQDSVANILRHRLLHRCHNGYFSVKDHSYLLQQH